MGIEVDKVQEVLRFHGATPVPLAPSLISGLINLRGQIVTAVDLGSRFGLPDREDGGSTVLVLRTGSRLISFVVDRSGDVVEVDESSFEKPPDTLKGESRRLIRGTYKLDRKLLLVLDVDHAIDVGAGSGGDQGP